MTVAEAISLCSSIPLVPASFPLGQRLEEDQAQLSPVPCFPGFDVLPFLCERTDCMLSDTCAKDTSHPSVTVEAATKPSFEANKIKTFVL